MCDPGKSCANGTDCTDDPYLCPTGPAECYARLTDTCNPACEPSRCGDRYTDPDGMNNQGGDYDDEECDEGSYCNDFVTDCSRDPSICPGGIFECRPRLKNGCSGYCSDASCGDGTLDINGLDDLVLTEDDEQCDDSNTAAGDGCSSTCTVEFCGDGYRDAN